MVVKPRLYTRLIENYSLRWFFQPLNRPMEKKQLTMQIVVEPPGFKNHGRFSHVQVRDFCYYYFFILTTIVESLATMRCCLTLRLHPFLLFLSLSSFFCLFVCFHLCIFGKSNGFGHGLR